LTFLQRIFSNDATNVYWGGLMHAPQSAVQLLTYYYIKMNINKLLLTGIAASIALTTPVMAKKGNNANKNGKAKVEKKDKKAKKAEREAKKAQKEEMLKRFDADKDGKLSKEEKKIARKTLKKEEMLKRFDADKDGKLSKEEKKIARKTLKKEGKIKGGKNKKKNKNN